MMNLTEIITLFLTMSALAAFPSASVALVITRAMTLGTINGIAVAAGIVLGDLVFMVLAIQGLSVVAETMGGFFIFVKMLGGLYLIWLGLALWRSRGAWGEPNHHAPHHKRGLLTSFIAGFILTLGDVKAILFYASLLPMFLDLSAMSVSDLATVLAIIVLAVGGVKVLYAVFAAQATRFLARRKLQKVSRKAAGILMMGAGGYLILKA